MADQNEPVNASLDGGDSSDPLGEDNGGGKKKMVVIIVILLLILGGAGAGLYFSGFLDKMLAKDETTEEVKQDAPKADGSAANPGAQFLKIPDMIVNLNTESGPPRYLRLSVQLEFKNATDLAAAEQVMPRIVDQFQTYLRELRVRDLRGSAGIYRLQIELLSRVNQAAYPVEVQDVLFQEILIQ